MYIYIYIQSGLARFMALSWPLRSLLALALIRWCCFGALMVLLRCWFGGDGAVLLFTCC